MNRWLIFEGGRWNIDGNGAAHRLAAELCKSWKRRFGGMGVSEAKRLRALEEENSWLKRPVADQAVQIHILKILPRRPESGFTLLF